MPVLILLTAAGGSTRMRGGDKLLEPVDGQPLLRRQAAMAASLGPVVVTLPPDRPARLAALHGLALDIALLPDASTGMSASLRHGARAAGARALLVLPADMPDIDAADLAMLLTAHQTHPQAVLRGADHLGTPGHPVLFPPDLLPEFAALGGDEGARSVLARHKARIQLVPLAGKHALTDLDTPEDWAAWRAGRRE